MTLTTDLNLPADASASVTLQYRLPCGCVYMLCSTSFAPLPEYDTKDTVKLLMDGATFLFAHMAAPKCENPEHAP